MTRAVIVALFLALTGCATVQGMGTDLKQGTETVAGWFGG